MKEESVGRCSRDRHCSHCLHSEQGHFFSNPSHPPVSAFLSLLTFVLEHALLAIYTKPDVWRRVKNLVFRTMYLDHVGGDAIPQREDALVFDNLYETVSHSTEVDVDSTKMWEVCALSLQQGERGTGEVSNPT